MRRVQIVTLSLLYGDLGTSTSPLSLFFDDKMELIGFNEQRHLGNQPQNRHSAISGFHPRWLPALSDARHFLCWPGTLVAGEMGLLHTPPLPGAETLRTGRLYTCIVPVAASCRGLPSGVEPLSPSVKAAVPIVGSPDPLHVLCPEGQLGCSPGWKTRGLSDQSG